ncbi:MAG: recombinase family protein, partial [Myxococcales bacterium]|nr:recombinase family protein [Myxococcales bacterium]
MMAAQSAQRTRCTHRSQLERAAVGYARRSTDKQEQSIPDQQRAIERYCQDNGLVLQRWFIDDAISGTRASNRPAFQDMVHAAGTAGRDFGVVVVYDVKRFGRLDNDEAGFYRHTLRQHGVEVLYVAEGFAGFGETSDTDDLLRPVKQWQARQESKDLSKVTIRGQLTKADSGS